MLITLQQAAERLKNARKVLVLSHRSPDGDTLGSASALCIALHRMGKKVRFACSDEMDKKYRFLFAPMQDWMQAEEDFSPDCVVSVDIADVGLFGDGLAAYTDKVDLCLDHHRSRGDFAKESYVDPRAAATGEILYELLNILDVEIDEDIANSLYTALATDTGCFKYSNTTACTLRIAANLLDAGIDAAQINRAMFDTWTHSRLALEKRALDQLRVFHGGLCVTMEISQAILEETGATGADLDSIVGIPRQIEGAYVGVTIRERKDGGYKISLRGEPPVDCSQICEEFGGGGHKGAAGCVMPAGSLEEAREAIVKAVGEHLYALGLLEETP